MSPKEHGCSMECSQADGSYSNEIKQAIQTKPRENGWIKTTQ